jgi:acetolactate synthase-1/2/3 large subunit
MVRQWQQLFYDRRYAITCLNHRKSCSKNCKNKSEKCPVYSPNFVKLAESYDAAGIRVTKEEEIRTAFLQAMKNRTKPTVIEFMIDSEELVLPMVKSGEALQDMITGLW